MVTATSTGFQAQFESFVYFAGPILQLLYWAVMIVAALWAVLLFKRWVDANVKTPEALASQDATEADAAPGADTPKREPIKVEEFVE